MNIKDADPKTSVSELALLLEEQPFSTVHATLASSELHADEIK